MQFIQFADQQISVTSPWKISLNAPDIEANASRFAVNADSILLNGKVQSLNTLKVTGQASLAGGATIGGIAFGDHVHGGVQSGGAQTGKPQ